MTVREVLENADKELQKALKEELRAQGHYLTGTLEQSIQGEIVEQVKSATLTGTALFYSGILSDGVPAHKIPYGGGGGGGGTSKYITALINYFILRGLDEAEAKKAAFATANKQKKRVCLRRTASSIPGRAPG